MPMVRVTVNVMDGRCGRFGSAGQDFKVTRIVNTTKVKIDEWLTADQVDTYILAGWTINIIPYKRG